MAVRAAVGGRPVSDATVKVSFALAANLACMMPCMVCIATADENFKCVCA